MLRAYSALLAPAPPLAELTTESKAERAHVQNTCNIKGREYDLSKLGVDISSKSL